MATPVPLALATRRIAPFVAAGLIHRAEAVEAVMELAIERCNWTPAHLAEVEAWIGATLDRAARAAPKLVAPDIGPTVFHQRGLTAAAERADRRDTQRGKAA